MDKSVGLFFRKRREQLGFTRLDLVMLNKRICDIRKYSISINTLHFIEHSFRLPSLETFIYLCLVLKISDKDKLTYLNRLENIFIKKGGDKR
jgi:transcriptional regulator with XRE-family HTH domain